MDRFGFADGQDGMDEFFRHKSSIQPIPIVSKEDIPQIIAKNNRILNDILITLETLRQYISKTSGFDIKEKYFSQDLTAITIATPNKPETSDVLANANTNTPGYDRIPVNQQLGRNARTITLSNDGTTILYAVVSNDGHTWTPEFVIPKGEYKRFLNVYEIRVRSPDNGIIGLAITVAGITRTIINQGGLYRVTEHETENVLVNINRTAIFILASTILALGTGVTVFTITEPLVNTTTAFRAYINNTGVIYATYSGGTITDATQRVTLNPGDAFKVNITDGAQVRFAGQGAGQIVELLIESDIVTP